jgi:hypothetical protein
MTGEIPTGPQPDEMPAQDLETTQAIPSESSAIELATDPEYAENETVPPEPTEVADIVPAGDEMLETPKKKKNMPLLIMSGVFLLALLGFVAFLLYTKGYFGETGTQTADLPPMQTAPAPAPAPTTTPRTTTPTNTSTPPPMAPMTNTAPTAATPVAPTQPVVELTPEQKLIASLPKVATPVAPVEKPAGVVPEIFGGGPPPPRQVTIHMDWATSTDLAQAVGNSKRYKGVQVSSGRDAHEATLLGKKEDVSGVIATLVPAINIKPSPIITVAALSPVYPTEARGPITPWPQGTVPLDPMPGRNAGWIYNAGNGQTLAIYEDRTGVAHTVKVGDEVTDGADKLRVTAISPAGMVLLNTRNNKEYRLPLQGLDNAQNRTPVTASPFGMPGR